MSEATDLTTNPLHQELIDLGHRIRQTREQRGLSRAALAQRADVGEQTLIRIEEGNPGCGLLNVQKVLAVLGLSLDLRQPVLPLHARHVDDTDVDDALERAASAACKELDALFPGARPEVNGICTNFIGTLKDHLAAMLTGRVGHVPSHHVWLPKLVADYQVFGRPFELPAEPGAGYLVIDELEDRVLDAYRGRFKAGLLRRLPDGRLATAKVQDMDVLFTSHELATKHALKALKSEDTVPAERRIRIVAAVWVDEQDRYVQCAEKAKTAG